MVTKIPQVAPLYDQLKAEVKELLKKHPLEQTHLIGIYSGGAWLAEQLQKDLNLQSVIGLINTSFYRDDYNKIGLHSQTQPSSIPFNVDDKHLILIDDILYTGRSVRAALNELFDYGRPASVSLGVLIDRGGRQLPIQPDACGGVYPLDEHTQFVLSQDETEIFNISLKEVN